MTRLAQEELIGKYITIKKSKNHSLEGLNGLILDETKNFFVIETEKNGRKERKKIIKSQCDFYFSENHDQIEQITISGQKIVGRPEDRIKIKVKNGKKN
ncbi:MAG: ribonuclease P protein subunit [Nanoarchaeota archaeon]|nr:ribonuclease P protein subunit [Nanoarchaeota archaeon]